MAVTDWKFSGAGAEVARSGDDGGSWSGLANITASDDTYASYSVGASGYGSWLVAAISTTDIPTAAVIHGVEVRIEHKGESGIRDEKVQIDTQDSSDPPASDNKGNDAFLGTESTDTYGGATDTWGLTLTGTHANGSLWVWVSYRNSLGSAKAVDVDGIEFRIHYTNKWQEFLQSGALRCWLLTATVYSGGSAVTRYLSNRPYISESTDTPARQPFLPLLEGDSDFERQLGSVLGLRAISRGGDLHIMNPGRDYDSWLEDTWHGQRQIIQLGDPTWPLSWFQTMFDGQADTIRADDDRLIVRLKANDVELRKPAQAVIESHGPKIGENRVVCIGEPLNVKPPKIASDPDDAYYRMSEKGPVEDPAVTRYVNQETSTSPSIVKQATDDNFQFTLATLPGGVLTCDPKGIKVGGTYVSTPGAAIEHLLTRDHPNLVGVAAGGGPTHIDLDQNASDVDDFYNGDTVRKSDSNDDQGNEQTITDYVGSTRRATVASWSPGIDAQAGDGYEILGRTMDDIAPYAAADLVTNTGADFDTAIGSPTVGIWIDRNQSYHQIISEIIGPAAYYALNRSGKFSLGELVDPSGATADLSLDEHQLHGNIEIEKWLPPAYRLHVGYARNYTPARGGVSASGLSGAREEFITDEYRYCQVKEDPTILDQYPNARELTINTLYVNEADAISERDRIWPLVNTQRKLYGVEAFAAPMLVDIGAVISISHSGYYDLDGGKNLFLYRMRETMSGRTFLNLWG